MVALHQSASQLDDALKAALQKDLLPPKAEADGSRGHDVLELRQLRDRLLEATAELRTELEVEGANHLASRSRSPDSVQSAGSEVRHTPMAERRSGSFGAIRPRVWPSLFPPLLEESAAAHAAAQSDLQAVCMELRAASSELREEEVHAEVSLGAERERQATLEQEAAQLRSTAEEMRAGLDVAARQEREAYQEKLQQRIAKEEMRAFAEEHSSASSALAMRLRETLEDSAKAATRRATAAATAQQQLLQERLIAEGAGESNSRTATNDVKPSRGGSPTCSASSSQRSPRSPHSVEEISIWSPRTVLRSTLGGSEKPEVAIPQSPSESGTLPSLNSAIHSPIGASFRDEKHSVASSGVQSSVGTIFKIKSMIPMAGSRRAGDSSFGSGLTVPGFPPTAQQSTTRQQQPQQQSQSQMGSTTSQGSWVSGGAAGVVAGVSAATRLLRPGAARRRVEASAEASLQDASSDSLWQLGRMQQQ